MRRSVLAVFLCLVMFGAIASFGPARSLAANANVGKIDFPYDNNAVSDDPTADKPQSKLWYNDGAWWAVLNEKNPVTNPNNTWHIFKLNPTSAQTQPNEWIDTGVVADDRPLSRADSLWDNTNKKLYIGSTKSNVNGSDASNQGRLYRYSYANGVYTLDQGFPVVMFIGSVESTTIDKDTTGQIWVTFTRGKQVFVNRSLKDANGVAHDESWNTNDAFVMPNVSPNAAYPTPTSLATDDISSLVAYKGNIGVLWSNHNNPSSMYFAYHKDGDPDKTWQPIEQIYTATCAADDHISLKSIQADAQGRVFAAVKTSFGDSGCGGSSVSPLLQLVVRKADKTWSVAVFGKVGDDHTRPVILLDTDNSKVYMFATSPTSCGVIYMKSTSMDSPDFSNQPGKGTPFISSSTYTCMNNATSTKQTVNNATGLVVLASDKSKYVYAHNVMPLGAPVPDTTAPTVTSKTPAANAAGVNVGASVTATFSEGVNGVSGSTFTLSGPGGAVVPAAVTYSSGTATLKPNASLAFNTTYSASLLAGIADTANNPLAPLSWSFTTAAAPPPTSLLNGDFELDSNGDNRPDSWSSSSKFTRSAAIAPHAGSYAGRLLATDNSGVTISQVVNSLVPGTTYTFAGWTNIPATSDAFTIKYELRWQNSGGSTISTSAIKSYSAATGGWNLTSASLVAPANAAKAQLRMVVSSLNATIYVDDFSFGNNPPPADTTKPAVTNKTPAANATSVSTGTSVTTTFSEGVNGVSGSTFTLTDPSNTAVPALVTYSNGVATLQPSAALAFNTTYSANLLAGIADGAGNALDPISWSFTTAAAPAPDTTAPTVTSTNPAANATSVSTGTSVTASFSEGVNGVSGSTFTLTDPSNTAVPALVTYSNGVATLQPSAALAFNTTYSANLLAGIADGASNALDPISWSFTTAAAPPAGTSITFTPAADAWVNEASPTSTSGGSSSALSIVDSSSAGDKQAFLRFTVSGLPAGTVINSAKLKLYVTNDSTTGGIFQRVSNNTWAEALAWSAKPPIDGPAIAALGAVALNSTVEIDLSGVITGNGDYSFAIVAPAGNTNTLAYASREASTANTRPQLVITTN